MNKIIISIISACIYLFVFGLPFKPLFAEEIADTESQIIKEYFCDSFNLKEDSKDFNEIFNYFYDSLSSQDRAIIVNKMKIRKLTEYKDIPELVKIVKGSSDTILRIDAMNHLANFKEDFLMPVFIECLYDKEGEISLKALEILNEFDKEDYLWIIDLLDRFKNKNLSTNIKEVGPVSIIEKNNINNINQIEKDILSAKEANKKLFLIRQLGETKSHEIINFLLDLLVNGIQDENLKIEIAIALYKVNNDIYRAILESLDFGGFNLTSSLNALSKINNYFLDKILIRILEKNEYVRNDIYKILSYFPSKKIVDLIEKYETKTNDEELIFEIADRISIKSAKGFLKKWLTYPTNEGGWALANIKKQELVFRSYINVIIEYFNSIIENSFKAWIMSRLENVLAPEMKQLLIKGLSDKDNDIFVKAYNLALKFKSKEIISELCDKVFKLKPDEDGKFTELYNKLILDMDQAVLRESLKSENRDVRFSALVLIKKRRLIEFVTEAMKLINDPDPIIRKNAISIIGTMGGTNEIPKLVPFLKNENSDIRNLVKDILSRMADGTAIPELSTLLKSDNPELRRNVMYILRRMENEEAIPIFKNSLNDHSIYVKKEALFGLYLLGSVNLELLKDLFEKEQNENILLTIIRIINWENMKEIVPWLMDNIDKFNDPIKVEIFYTAGNLGMSDFKEIIKKYISNSNPNLKIAAMNVLTEMGDSYVVDNYEKLSKDEDKSVRLNIKYIIDSIAKKGSRKDIKSSLDIVEIIDGKAVVHPLINNNLVEKIKIFIRSYPYNGTKEEKILVLDSIKSLLTFNPSQNVELQMLYENRRCGVIDEKQFLEAFKIEDEDVLDFFDKVFMDQNPEVRIKVLNVLKAPCYNPNVLHLLKKALDDQDKQVRQISLLLIDSYYDQRFHELEDNIIRILKEQPETIYQLSSPIYLKKIKKAIPVLYSIAQDYDSKYHFNALETLGMMGDYLSIHLMSLIFRNKPKERENVFYCLQYLLGSAEKEHKIKKLDYLLLKYFYNINMEEAGRVLDKAENEWVKDRIQILLDHLKTILKK